MSDGDIKINLVGVDDGAMAALDDLSEGARALGDKISKERAETLAAHIVDREYSLLDSNGYALTCGFDVEVEGTPYDGRLVWAEHALAAVGAAVGVGEQ